MSRKQNAIGPVLKFLEFLLKIFKDFNITDRMPAILPEREKTGMCQNCLLGPVGGLE